jgi:hypothetical protein
MTPRESASIFVVFPSGDGWPRRGYALGRGGLRLAGPQNDCDRRLCGPNYLDNVAGVGDVDGNSRDDLFVFSTTGDRGYLVLAR